MGGRGGSSATANAADGYWKDDPDSIRPLWRSTKEEKEVFQALNNEHDITRMTFALQDAMWEPQTRGTVQDQLRNFFLPGTQEQPLGLEKEQWIDVKKRVQEFVGNLEGKGYTRDQIGKFFARNWHFTMDPARFGDNR